MRESRATFLLLAGLAFLVVMIASANVASLNFARLAQRSQELAIREAVGAAPGQIARQLLGESLLFALAGALLGLLVAWPALDLLRTFAAGYSPLAGAIRFDHTLLFWVLGTALLTALLSGFAPAFGRRDLNAALKEGGGKATLSPAGMRYRKALMLVQFALSFAVLTSAALILFSLQRLDGEDTGYDAERVLALSVPLNLDLSASNYPAQMLHFGSQVLEQVQALPGVVSAGLYTGVPMLQDAAFTAAFPMSSKVRRRPIGTAIPLPRSASSRRTTSGPWISRCCGDACSRVTMIPMHGLSLFSMKAPRACFLMAML